ncbi:elongator complex protein 3 [Dehalogenimonas formicexedens]|uniref:Elongator complex protein 3 n=1 Tax=Dehalogenimonas formicexedens TaxID=1839801 RepID=A0A1P8F783_9CHLR|nr:tRNA uridine(34) 5-carboxymethylaminomethyl modification radical SAM/GNAT enzyme Elp3 [Dehalogenimonas formicexedens]APV44285.1 elongator complex protein 3 [Dehalogenimonas formicexedens]
MKKLTRTISGVTPVAVMSRPAPCPGRCVYCPDFSDTPRSYTPHSPAVMRAVRYDYDPGAQVKARLRILSDMGHPTDKVELIVMGGTFLATPVDYQNSFIKSCFDALNGSTGVSLEDAQKTNELSANRAVGLCIETRPDYCGDAEIERMIKWGTTRVELGVQTLDDNVYRLINRGHDVSAVIGATARLRRAGLKVHYHWMPGLPGSTPENDLAMTKRLFNDPNFQPDGIKIYPTMVIENTELEKWQREHRYEPYNDETMIKLIAEMKINVPPYVRISRVLRDIPSEYITGGLKNSLRDGVKSILQAQGLNCQCIRCREFGHRKTRNFTELVLRRREYEASGGKELFLSIEDETDTLFGLLRLRIQDQEPDNLQHISERIAIVRELHVYGPELQFGEKGRNSAQHRGIGRQLLQVAEKIALNEFGMEYIGILSGVGARNYYREHGYEFRSGYMIKQLKPPVS